MNGDENVKFNAQNNVTCGEYLKMLITSADISESELSEAVRKQAGKITEEINGHWAKKYICYGLDNGIITLENVSGENSPDSAVLRCDAAYMINRLYIDKSNENDRNIPSNLYKIDLNTLSSDRGTLWKTGKAFEDQDEIAYCKEEIGQLYLNRIMDGDTDGNSKWDKEITRAEAAKLLIKCRFSLDEGIKTIQIIDEGESNYI